MHPVGAAIGERIEAFAAKAGKQRQKSGKSEDGSSGGRGKKTLRQSFPKGKQNESARTTAQASSAGGVSRPTYEKAKAVVESGDKDLIAKMDATGKVFS